MVASSIFIFGLIVGSFLNACIYRLHSGDSIVYARSVCPYCQHSLRWLDLIPLVSFFILRGRCRYCKKKISWQYPLVEAATALLFLVIYYQTSAIDYRLFFLFAFTGVLIVIFVYDLKHYLILDRVVYPAAVFALLYQIIEGRFLDALLGAAMLFGFFGFLFLISKGKWIGLGDVKLGIFLGFLIPFPETLVLFFLAYWIGALFSLALIWIAGKKLSDKVPFGTFLTVAAFLAMLWGEGMVEWYMHVIGYG